MFFSICLLREVESAPSTKLHRRASVQLTLPRLGNASAWVGWREKSSRPGLRYADHDTRATAKGPKAGHRATDNEDEGDKLFDEMLRLEEQAALFEPVTLEDMAFKIIFAEDNSDMDMNIEQALVAMSYRMVGIEPPNRFGKPL